MVRERSIDEAEICHFSALVGGAVPALGSVVCFRKSANLSDQGRLAFFPPSTRHPFLSPLLPSLLTPHTHNNLRVKGAMKEIIAMATSSEGWPSSDMVLHWLGSSTSGGGFMASAGGAGAATAATTPGDDDDDMVPDCAHTTATTATPTAPTATSRGGTCTAASRSLSPSLSPSPLSPSPPSPAPPFPHGDWLSSSKSFSLRSSSHCGYATESSLLLLPPTTSAMATASSWALVAYTNDDDDDHQRHQRHTTTTDTDNNCTELTPPSTTATTPSATPHDQDDDHVDHSHSHYDDPSQCCSLAHAAHQWLDISDWHLQSLSPFPDSVGLLLDDGEDGEDDHVEDDDEFMEDEFMDGGGAVDGGAVDRMMMMDREPHDDDDEQEDDDREYDLDEILLSDPYHFDPVDDELLLLSGSLQENHHHPLQPTR